MYDHDTSMRRGAVRQRETEDIMRGIYELEETIPREKVTQYLSMLILQRLLDPKHNFAITFSEDGEAATIRRFFNSRLIVAVEKFAQNIEEEQRVILGNLLQILVSGVVDPIRLAYAKLESEFPGVAYPGPGLHVES